MFLVEVKIGGWKDLNFIKFKRLFFGIKIYIYCEFIILIFIIYKLNSIKYYDFLNCNY